MRFEMFVATRYLRGKRKNHFVNLITIISVAGVCVGVMALIVVMSVMTGFDIELRAATVGNRAHLTVSSRHGEAIKDWEKVIQDIEKASPEIVAASPLVQCEALLNLDGATTGGVILGVDVEREKKVTDLEENLSSRGGRTFAAGETPKEKEIVLGYRLAQRIGATVGSEIMVMTMRPTVKAVLGKQTGTPIWLRVSGISQARMSDIDMLFGYVDLPTARMLSGRDGVDAVHAKLTDPFLANPVRDRINANLNYNARTWFDDGEAFFNALKQEKLVMFIILAFIILVAAFNITSTLIMIVMEKRRDIGILRTIGTGGGSILLLFMVQGLIIGVGGTIAGVTLGTIFAYNLNPIAEFIAWVLGVNLFDSTIYYFDHIPVQVVPFDIFWITVSAIALTFLSTLYPAWSAVRVNPVDALRYE
jgi:lipoprotein-releasing system permease protein